MATAREDFREICAIVLAAGAGSRFRAGADTVVTPSFGDARHKLLADLRGRPVFRWALDAVLAAGFADVVLVTGAVELDVGDVDPGVSRLTVARNPRWAEGQASSLQCGLRVAAQLGATAMIVGLGDQPFITADAWQAVAASPAEIAVATYAGVRGNPVLLRESVWPLLPIAGDQGARSLIAQRPDLVGPVACIGSPADIDTMEDLQQWNSSTNSP
ncbi:MAG: hypothetical protein JWM34_432 [Ilumatobacteraceae bacterium]|nr:hypothetical protein [Ilumatobacteraceae bacterium]